MKNHIEFSIDIQTRCSNLLIRIVHYYYNIPLQLIYDFKDGGGSLGLISLLPDELPREDRERFIKIGVETPSME